MKDKLVEIVETYGLIEEKDNILVGVSGGPDSMALLYVLLDLQDTIDFNIYMAHVNHGVRGQEARRDQEFVERIAKELKLPYYTINVDMVGHGREKGISAEEAGRELRYGFFRRVLKGLGGGKIAVAHNKNDQAETLLMRFMRGTGLDGLKGMDYIFEDIIRPLLGISREEIESYIDKRGIETVLDRTNLESIYTRNRIRLDLIPYIEEHFNPNIVETLWRMSRLSSIESGFLEGYSEEKLNSLVKSHTNNSIILDRAGFIVEDRAVQQRIIRLAISRLIASLQGITEVHVSSILNNFLLNESGKEIHIARDLVARISYDDLIIERATSGLQADYSYPVTYPGKLKLEEIGYCLDLKLYENDASLSLVHSRKRAYFDLDKIKGGLKIRNRRDGDRFKPFGMKGSKKLKDYFIDEKLARQIRNELPLLVDGENILWVLGFRTSDLYKVEKDSKRILEVSFVKDQYI